jgi:Protein of unknown function (DUF3455)
MNYATLLSLACFLLLSLTSAQANLLDAVAAPSERPVTVVHAEGAQIYECKMDAHNNLVWQFREPIATLMIDGKTVGRHYAGPN